MALPDGGSLRCKGYPRGRGKTIQEFPERQGENSPIEGGECSEDCSFFQGRAPSLRYGGSPGTEAAAQRGHAAALICAHNHPSGHPAPSPEDEAVTEELVYAGRLLGLPLLDHLIVGEGGYFSFADAGLIARYNAAFDRAWPRRR